jgi:hypothetical protein
MKKLLAVCASLFLSLPAIAEPVVKDYSMDAMGCMILLECSKGVDRVNYNYDFGPSVPTEFKNWNYTVIHTFKARKFVRPPRKYKRIHIA